MFFKPSRLEAIERKDARKAERRKAKTSAERMDRESMAALRDACFKRDGSRCRACRKVVRRSSDYQLEIGHAHHIVYRSAGGANSLDNLVLLCAACHDLEHRHILHIRKDAAGVLTFKAHNPETGQLLREWDSREQVGL